MIETTSSTNKAFKLSDAYKPREFQQKPTQRYPQKSKKRAVTKEVAGITQTGVAKYLGDVLPNPDRILQHKAGSKGYDFYREMTDTDPHLSSCIRSRRLAVLNKPWSIVPASDKRRDVKLAGFIKDCITFPRWREAMSELLEAIAMGFSVAEIILYIDEDDKLKVKDIKGRGQDSFVFGTDYELRLITDDAPLEGEKIPQWRFLYMRHEPRPENPYGSGVLKEAYWYWWFKKNGVKFWLTLLERFGMPTLLVEYDESQYPEDADIEKLDDIVKTYMQGAGIKFPKGLIIKLLEAQRQGDVRFKDFADYCDAQNEKVVHGRTLSGLAKSAPVHAMLYDVDTKQEYNAHDCELLMDCINNQLIPVLIDLNFDSVPKAARPRFKIHYEPPEDEKAKVGRDKVLFKDMGLPVALGYLYKTYNVPEPEEGEELLKVPKVQSPFDRDIDEEADDNESGSISIDKDFSGHVKRSPAYDRHKLPKRGRRIQIGSTYRIRDKWYRRIKGVMMQLEPQYVELLAENAPLSGAIYELIRNHFEKGLDPLLTASVREGIVLSAQSIADQLKLTINKQTFAELMDEYFKTRAYEKGTIDGIANTFRSMLNGQAQALYDQKLSLSQIKKRVKTLFPEFTDWRAMTIANTEVMDAASWAGIEMMHRTGLKTKAYFLVDPASCPICQDWAAANPYTLEEAKRMGRPHPNCDDQWTFVVEEGVGA